MAISEELYAQAQAKQYQAAHDSSGSIRLVAGPGTGKSRSIEERVRWLIEEGHISPTQIYAVSFTRAASRDLKDRIVKYCEEKGITSAVLVHVSTLHSLGLTVLRKAGQLDQYPTDPSVLDEWEIKEIFEAEYSFESGRTPGRCELIRRDHEAFWSTGQWDPTNYIPPDPPISEGERSEFLAFHGPRTQVYSCVLASEIVRKCVDGHNSGTLDAVELLNAEQLIVDEFQDLNPCDIEFVDHFAGSEVATFVAGDDDQSMYSFRFATPSGIQQFTTSHPGAADHRLEMCLRSAVSIVSTANNLITHYAAPGRIPKTLEAAYALANPPVNGQIHRLRYASAQREAAGVAEGCRRLIAAGVSPKDILILLSSVDQCEKLILDALTTEDVPFEPTRRARFIDEPVGRAVLAITRLICNPNDYVAYRILLGLHKNVGLKTTSSIANKVITNALRYRDIFDQPIPAGIFTTRELSAIQKVRDIVEVVGQVTPEGTLAEFVDALNAILAKMSDKYDLEEWNKIIGPLPGAINFQELRDYLWANTDEQRANVLKSVYDRLEMEFIEEDLIPNKVRLMTMHGAKGLSAKVVFVPCLEEEIFPGRWRHDYAGLILEAARMLYVAITRARAACVLSYSGRRTMYGQSKGVHASRFCTYLSGQFIYATEGISEDQAADIASDCEAL